MRDGDERARNERPLSIETLAPARNFTVTLAQQMRAAAGVPAFALRRRRIEDLEGVVVATLTELITKLGSRDRARAQAPNLRKLVMNLAELARQVDGYNAYYPIEANLPIEPRTGRLLEWGQPWKKLSPPSLDELLLRAEERARARALEIPNAR